MAIFDESTAGILNQFTSNSPQAQGPAPTPPPLPNKIFGGADTSMLDKVQGADSMPPDPMIAATPGLSPENPKDVSPVSVEDRALMSLGNAKGSLGYLKSKFDDVKFVPNKGLVVKQGNQWSQVNPDWWGGGDAWDKTKEVVKDGASLLGPAVTQLYSGLGAIGGTLTSGPGGSVLGAGFGGSLGGYVKSSLGRLAGTYDATPDEQVKDVALEGLLNAGGQLVALGAKPLISNIATAVKSFAQNAAPGVRNTMASLLSKTADIAPENAQRLFDRADPIMQKVTEATASQGTEGVAAALKDSNINQARNLVANAQKALSANFDGMEKDLLESVPKNFKLDLGDTVQNAFSKLAETGALTPKVVDGETVGYQLSHSGLMDLLKHPEGDGAISQEAFGALKRFVDTGNKFMDAGTLEGQDAVQGLLNVRRSLDDFYFKSTAANPSMKQLLTPLSSEVRNSLVQEIGNVSPEVAQKYAAMNQMYAEKMPWVAQAYKYSKTLKGPETLVNQLMSGAEDNRVAKQLVDVVSGLKGKAGEFLGNDLKDGIAAHDFIAKWPQLGPSKITGATGLGFLAHAVGVGPAAAVAGVAAAPLTSPRLIGRAVQAGSNATQSVLPYMEQFGAFMKNLAPEQMKQLIQSPELFNSVVRTSITSHMEESAMKNQLLQQAGVQGQ